MVQQLYNDLEKIKAEIRRLRGDFNAIATGGRVIPNAIAGGGGVQLPLPVSGAILYGTGVPEWARLAPGTNGEILTLVSGFPSWEPNAAAGDIETFPTSETDDTLRLAPDGVGGVEWVAGGGGGLTTAFFADRLFTSLGSTALILNSASYVIFTFSRVGIDLDVIPWTHYKLRFRAASNAVGQTVTVQLAVSSAAPDTPVHTGGDDLVITNTAGLFDSGWLTRDDGATGTQEYFLAFKGSNATVDLDFFIMEIWWKYDP